VSAFAVTPDGRVLARFDEAERTILLSLSHQFSELLAQSGTAPSGGDPAIARLFPDAYRDDPEASDEFRRFTRQDLAAAKIAAASTVQEALAGAPAGGSASAGSTGDGIVLDAAAGWSWLRHLTDVRLTIAARLGIVDDPHAFDDDPDPDLLSEDDLLARSVFDWIGYVQELLIGALEDAGGMDTEGSPANGEDADGSDTGGGAAGPSSPAE
jgi:hypothetical protein